jgi:hypothetical protein
MDTATLLGVAAIVVSLISLCTSAILTYRQIRLGRHANHADALLGLYTELRKPQFHAHYNYVVHQLGLDYRPDGGIFGLPVHAQAAVVDVAYYYQNLANLMEFGLLDKTTVLPMIRTRIINLWLAIEPFVKAERQREVAAGPITFLMALERYAADARALPESDD